MHISDKGLALLKEFEGLRLTAYQCSAYVWTIGYGHTRNVKEGDKITEQQAEQYLREDVHDAELAVQREVYFGLAPPHFDALVSLVFNIGINAFRQSTLLKKLNSSDIVGAANEFNRWNKAGGKVNKGLRKRRDKERLVFLNGYY